MAAYIHASVEITDPDTYDQYRSRVAAVVEAHGGRFLARGGAVTLLEGGPVRGRQVILEFPDMAALQGFYHSPAYQALVAIRQRASEGTLVAIEGV